MLILISLWISFGVSSNSGIASTLVCNDGTECAFGRHLRVFRRVEKRPNTIGANCALGLQLPPRAIRQGPTDFGIEHFGCVRRDIRRICHRRCSRAFVKPKLRELILRFEVLRFLHIAAQNVVAQSVLRGTQNSFNANSAMLAMNPTTKYGAHTRHRLTPAARMAVISLWRAWFVSV